MPPGQHSELGASSSDRWMNCPGSVALSRGLPDSTSSYATEGTAAHDLSERALRTGLDCLVWLDTEIPVAGQHVLVTEEMAEAAQVYVDYVRGRVETGAELLIEQKFDLGKLNPPGPMFGTADAVLWWPKTRTLEICDYKHGQGVVVEAVENSQFAYYALGAVLKLGKKPKLIRMTVAQPRAYHPAGPVRSHEFTYEQLVDFKRELFARAELAMQDNAPLAAGDHCRWCKVAAKCPERLRVASELAQSEFGVEVAVAPPKPELLTTEQLVGILQHKDAIEKWLEEVYSYAFKALERGEELPGYKLVDKRSSRKWKDEEEAERVVGNLLGEEAYTRKFVSPAQAEKLLKGFSTKLPERLVEKVSSGKKLAPDSDPRTAKLPAAQEDFVADASKV
jgi:hypothetical protein